MPSGAVKTNLVESNTYIGDPEYKPIQVYVLVDPNGFTDDREYVNFRSMLNDCEGTDIHEVAHTEYCSNKEGPFNEEDFDSYYFDNFERIAWDLGFRIIRVVR